MASHFYWGINNALAHFYWGKNGNKQHFYWETNCIFTSNKHVCNQVLLYYISQQVLVLYPYMLLAGCAQAGGGREVALALGVLHDALGVVFHTVTVMPKLVDELMGGNTPQGVLGTATIGRHHHRLSSLERESPDAVVGLALVGNRYILVGDKYSNCSLAIALAVFVQYLVGTVASVRGIHQVRSEILPWQNLD